MYINHQHYQLNPVVSVYPWMTELAANALKNCVNIKKCIENVDNVATNTGKYFSSRPETPF